MKTRDSSNRSTDPGSVIALLVGLVAGGFAILFMNFILTMLYWKAAVALNGLVAAGGVMFAARSSDRTLMVRVGLGAMALMGLAGLALFQDIWASHAEHDARLSRMVETLCRVDVPEPAQVDNCGGSISNTGNGNSCQYWARAVVRTAESIQPVLAELEAQGFQETELNIWNEPMSDGMPRIRVTDFGLSAFGSTRGPIRAL